MGHGEMIVVDWGWQRLSERKVKTLAIRLCPCEAMNIIQKSEMSQEHLLICLDGETQDDIEFTSAYLLLGLFCMNLSGSPPFRGRSPKRYSKYEMKKHLCCIKTRSRSVVVIDTRQVLIPITIVEACERRYPKNLLLVSRRSRSIGTGDS